MVSLKDKKVFQDNMIVESESINENSYNIMLENEDYTVGKVLEYLLYDMYFEREQLISYCGFLKKHPHNEYSIIRLIFIQPTDNKDILHMLDSATGEAINIFKKIKSEFSAEVTTD